MKMEYYPKYKLDGMKGKFVRVPLDVKLQGGQLLMAADGTGQIWKLRLGHNNFQEKRLTKDRNGWLWIVGWAEKVAPDLAWPEDGMRHLMKVDPVRA